MIPDLICPEDANPLACDQDGLGCPACGSRFADDGGVVRLLREPDAFYEGAYGNETKFIPRSERRWHAWPLWLINGGYVWAVRKHVSLGERVLELGCAGGVRYFGERYKMVGCDLSLAALAGLGSRYVMRVQCDVTKRIPLADGSVRAVVSSYFWEHIPPHLKPRLLAECFRVLAPGGKLVFLYDVETSNPLIAHFKKRDAARYEDLFLRNDGHLGYETPAANVAHFNAAGFDVIERLGLDKTPAQALPVYSKLAQFDVPAARMLSWTRWLGTTPMFYANTALLRSIDTALSRHLPDDWARADLVVCTKPVGGASAR